MTHIKNTTLVLLFAWLTQSSLANAALLSLQPDTTFASNGDSVALDLVVSGLGDFGPDSLGVFDIFVDYDPLALSFTGYTLDGFLGDLGLGEALDIGTGDGGTSVNIAEVSLLSNGELDALQPSEFVLATLNFGVLDLTAGETTQLSIPRGALLGDGDGNQIDVTGSQSAVIEGRASVPLPGTLLLCLIALFGLSLARRPGTTAALRH